MPHHDDPGSDRTINASESPVQPLKLHVHGRHASLGREMHNSHWPIRYGVPSLSHFLQFKQVTRAFTQKYAGHSFKGHLDPQNTERGLNLVGVTCGHHFVGQTTLGS